MAIFLKKPSGSNLKLVIDDCNSNFKLVQSMFTISLKLINYTYNEQQVAGICNENFRNIESYFSKAKIKI